jgi:hypothetical protein
MWETSNTAQAIFFGNGFFWENNRVGEGVQWCSMLFGYSSIGNPLAKQLVSLRFVERCQFTLDNARGY